MDGAGVLTWRNGDRFDGEWRKGRANGRGAYRQKDGKVFEGNWVDGCFQEKGTRIAVGRPLKECRQP